MAPVYCHVNLIVRVKTAVMMVVEVSAVPVVRISIVIMAVVRNFSLVMT